MKYIYNALSILLICFLLPNSTLAQGASVLDDVSYPFMERLIETAKENYPTVKGHDNRIKRAKIALTRAKIGWLAPISFSYIYTPRNTLNIVEPSLFNGVQFGLMFPFGTFLQNPWNVKIAREEAKASEIEKETYLLQLENDVKSKYFIYTQKMTSYKLYSRGAFDSESLLENMKYRYEKGEINFEEYSKALLAYYQQTQIKLEIEAEMLVAKSNLEELIGKKLEEVK